MNELEKKVIKLEEEIQRLQQDLAKLTRAYLERNKSRDEVERSQNNLLRDYVTFQTRISEKLEQVFDRVFPRHNRFLDEIESALEKAAKPKR